LSAVGRTLEQLIIVHKIGEDDEVGLAVESSAAAAECTCDDIRSS